LQLSKQKLVITNSLLDAFRLRQPPTDNAVISVDAQLQEIIMIIHTTDMNSDTGTDNFRGFPQFLQSNVWIAPRFGHDNLLPNPFQFISHPIILSYSMAWLLTAPHQTNTIRLKIETA
jgi:hypothetical protein